MKKTLDICENMVYDVGMNERKYIMKTIYLDMDGVLADFDSYYFRNGRKSFIFEEFRNEVMYNQLFSHLPEMPRYDEFISGVYDIAQKYGYDVQICSSVHSLEPEMKSRAMSQKTHWLKTHGLPNIKKNFTERKSQKADYASRDSILIDDSLECVSYFREAGGEAICHKEVSSTLKILEQIVKEKHLQKVAEAI